DGPVMAAASPGASENVTFDNTASGPRGVGYCLPTFDTASIRRRPSRRAWPATRRGSTTRTLRSVDRPSARLCNAHARPRTPRDRAVRAARDPTTANEDHWRAHRG